MRIQNISIAQSPSATSFKSVLRTDNDETTKKVYALLKLDKSKNVDIIKEDYLTIDDGGGPHLILIDDEIKDASSYLNLKKEHEDVRWNLHDKTDAELEKMLPKEEVEKFKEELTNPRSAIRTRGNTLREKLGGYIIADLSNKFDLKKMTLYKDFLAKAKIISVSEIFDAIVDIVKKSKS